MVENKSEIPRGLAPSRRAGLYGELPPVPVAASAFTAKTHKPSTTPQPA